MIEHELFRTDRHYTYAGKMMPDRKGQHCIGNVWARGPKQRNVLIVFDDGHRVIVPGRTLRRAK